MDSKKLFQPILPSLIAMAIWESFRFLLNKVIEYNNMEHIGITNFWFILFFISVNLLFFLLHLKNTESRYSKSRKSVLFSQNLFNNHGWTDLNGGSVIHYDDIAYSLNSSLAKMSGSYSDGAEKSLNKKIERNIAFSGYVYRPSKWSRDISTDRLSIEGENNNGYGFCIYHGSNVADIETIENGITVGRSDQKAFIAPKDQFYSFVLSIFNNGLIELRIYNSYGSKIFSLSHKDKRFKSFDRIAVRGEAPFYIDELKIETI